MQLTVLAATEDEIPIDDVNDPSNHPAVTTAKQMVRAETYYDVLSIGKGIEGGVLVFDASDRDGEAAIQEALERQTERRAARIEDIQMAIADAGDLEDAAADRELFQMFQMLGHDEGRDHEVFDATHMRRGKPILSANDWVDARDELEANGRGAYVVQLNVS